MRWCAHRYTLLLVALLPAPAIAQTANAARLAILQAEVGAPPVLPISPRFEPGFAAPTR